MAYLHSPSKSYILAVDQTAGRDHGSIENYGRQLHCPVVITESPAQAIAAAQLDHPYLVILSGDSVQQWSPQVVRQLRQSVQPSEVVIVAIINSSETSWGLEPEDTGLDGFFVEPVSPTILSFLNESAIAKYSCH